MRNLFNNPIFVIVLGSLAMGYLILFVIPPLFSDQASAFESEDVPPFDMSFAGLTPSSSVSGEVGHVDKEAITWLERHRRDPFATPGGRPREPSGDAPRLVPRLSAVFLGEHSASAVIDSKLVRVGDRVGRYRVLEIDRDGVVIGDSKSVHRLEPSA